MNFTKKTPANAFLYIQTLAKERIKFEMILMKMCTVRVRMCSFQTC